MQALVWRAARQMQLQNEPEPKATDDEIVMRVGHVGICGSELSGYLGHNALRRPPLIMGHEFAGEIVEMGPLVPQLRPDLQVGRLVTVNPLWHCGDCPACLAGMNQLCVNRSLLGAHRPGAFAEFVSVPAKLALTLPAGMNTRSGALTEPAGCAVRIAELAGAVADEDCLVIGAGPIGLLSLQMLRYRGAARVFIAELDAARLSMGLALGGIPLQPQDVDPVAAALEATAGAGVTVAVDAVGTAQTREQCVAATRPGGTIILSGLHEETSAMPVANMIRNEVVARGSFAYTPANFARALELLAEGALRLDPWIHEAPLKDGGRWFERLIEAPGAVAKVLLAPGG
ncbi:MAG: alcohol dehydrogenase catalytic domain-containing protein [Chloroflexi bacterium]|nr:alcohol dehydrogenase catalytic domain-containing protein [Chloroflexota bacterium]MCY4246786.1 alcohol dehydrogenase catalytic domain-containing protein [Chloroflexota bacterium]